MPVYTSEALILRTYKLGESDLIVVFLTRDRGKKRGVAKGARRSKKRFAGGLESLTRGLDDPPVRVEGRIAGQHDELHRRPGLPLQLASARPAGRTSCGCLAP